MTVGQFSEMFPTDEACKAYLIARRGPESVCCPGCGNDKLWHLKARPIHRQCRGCSHTGYRFSVSVGTPFDNTNVHMQKWYKVILMMLIGNKGVVALEVQRLLGFVCYETALYMTHRIRAALCDPDFRKLIGIVEVDETYVGGKNKHCHAANRLKGSGVADKFPVMDTVSRKGTLVSRAVESVNSGVAEASILEAVSEKVDLIETDESGVYAALNRNGIAQHKAVYHGDGEYLRGVVHIQTIDGIWLLLKLGILRTFQKVSAKYLPLYVAGFEFRRNNRNNADIFGTAAAGY